MKNNLNLYLLPLIYLVSSNCSGQGNMLDKIILKNDWSVQSSSKVHEDGKSISTITYQPENWFPASVPSTVLGALVDQKVYPDPYYGTNIESIPGYFTGRKKEMPESSPFRVPWWYRTVFSLPAEYKDKHTWLKFHSINYKANIWLNGHLIADTTTIEGAYRLYTLDITQYAAPGKKNCLALEIFPPKGMDLTITWVDWNPTPPDIGMGIWYDVTLRSSGVVAIENPHVVTNLDLPALNLAKLTVSAEIVNTEKKLVSGTLKGIIENIEFTQEVNLEPGEKRLVTFSPDQFRQLVISNPRLWWPHNMGPQNLYDLKLSFVIDGNISDMQKIRFGIREITSWMNIFDGKRTRVFQVNGKNTVIRGGGYVQDMLLRPSNERVDIDIRYAKHMNLNALRMEAPRGSDYLFDKCDEEGILLIVGWCCCSPWEQWKNWTGHIADVAEKSWHDQIIHLRNHPSIFTWFLGSDYFPPAEIEKRYIMVLDEFDRTRPYESSATRDSSAIAGFTGVEMGPYHKGYSYMPPAYWYGKREFNTEAGPTGEQIPPIESLRKMMPEKDLWPISKSWDIRLHKAFYPDAREALYSRYGTPGGVEEYCVTSQIFQFEAVRAMFEAYAGNKYLSSGIIYWMYNSAWPSLYWQLYDYFFCPNGAFYGAKKACEPLHLQYSYDDNSIRAINGWHSGFNDLNAVVKIYSFNMEEKFSKEIPLNVGPDESKKILTLSWPDTLSDVFFVILKLNDKSGKQISSNFYWLSLKGDEKADFTQLHKLSRVKLKIMVSPLQKEKGMGNFSVEIENPSTNLAFSINPEIVHQTTADLILPVFWEDNYFSLLPGEKRNINVQYIIPNIEEDHIRLKIKGWNIFPVEIDIN